MIELSRINTKKFAKKIVRHEIERGRRLNMVINFAIGQVTNED